MQFIGTLDDIEAKEIKNVVAHKIRLQRILDSI